MKTKILIAIGGLLAALLVAGVVGTTSAYAQGPKPPGSGVMGGGRGFGWSEAALEAAAKALGMTTDELTSALQSGKTLQELAVEKDVDIADVHAAIQAARVEEARERIAQAVANGTMTQEKADWLLEGLDNGFIGGGMGRGFGGPRGRGQGLGNGNGFGDCPMVQPTDAE